MAETKGTSIRDRAGKKHVTRRHFRANQLQCTEVADTGVEVLVARPQMVIQCIKGDRGRERSERGRKGGVGGCNGSVRRGVQGLDTLSDSLSMQITTITGNA